jgi:hypothetical protein
MYDPRLGLARSPFDDVADPDMLYPGVFHQSAHSELVSAVKTPESIESPAPVTPPIPSLPLSAASALAVWTPPVLPPPPSFLGFSPREHALVSAAETGDLGKVRRLFAAGVSPHARGAHGITPLMAAVANNHVETALARCSIAAPTSTRVTAGDSLR